MPIKETAVKAHLHALVDAGLYDRAAHLAKCMAGVKSVAKEMKRRAPVVPVDLQLEQRAALAFLTQAMES